MTCWFVSMEPSVPNLLRGRRVRRARVLHPLRTARNRPRATRCSFAPRGNDRGRGSRETRKRVKKEGSKVVSESRRRRRGARFRRVSRVGVVEPANRRRWMMRFFRLFFFALRASCALLLCLTAYHYRSRRAATTITSLRRCIGNPRAREASTPRRFTENLVTTADGATFRAVFL